ncbi:endonuclease [Acidianus sulfidivorans JP7]|uniref:Endonuclease n=1 Tax=Acidianus sulfidivorans JP7 TaxID=619593 RepID=A0A2U9IK38_9CREN|nr:Holliday junction resolvase Hjc [Acidianus sulfidivorans]AWR96380.1 endonuclease [Acidianus sulfidivorans JP7]
MNKNIGRNAERELVKILRSNGFNAVRIPTSNTSPNPLPDVFATRKNLLLSIEVKSTWNNKVKIEKIQVSKVIDFLSMFTMIGIPLIAVKFKGNNGGWMVHQLDRNKKEQIVITKENSIPLEIFLKSVSSIDKEAVFA